MSTLEKTAYICMISLSLLSGAVLVHKSLPLNGVGSPPVMLTEKELAGRKIEVPGSQWAGEEYTAVLFLSSHCHFCDASMPFYKRLVAIRQAPQPRRMPFIVVSREPNQDIERHLALYQFLPDHIYQLSSSATLLKGTPAILFVDHNGVIRHAFLGQLSGSKEKEFIELFSGANAKHTCQASQDCSA